MRRTHTGWRQLENQGVINVYFCEPRSPWQKPLAENVCGLLRRWLPRSQPMPTEQTTLDHYAHLLKIIPRRRPRGDIVQHRYHHLVATTGFDLA